MTPQTGPTVSADPSVPAIQITHATPAFQAVLAMQAAREAHPTHRAPAGPAAGPVLPTHAGRAPGADLTMYRAVHTAIRRAAHRMADAAAITDHRDAARARALARYWTGYAKEVIAHHTVEDVIVFPALRERVPAAVALTDRTDAEHAALDGLLERAGHAIARLTVPGMAREASAALRALARHMDDHLDFEDGELLPRIAGAFAQDEYEALEQKALEVVGVGKQAAFAVPFVVAAMSDEDRTHALTTAPRALRVLYRLTRRSHARLAARAGVA